MLQDSVVKRRHCEITDQKKFFVFWTTMAINGFKTDLEADIIRIINQNQNRRHVGPTTTGSMILKELLPELAKLQDCKYYPRKQQRAMKRFQNSPFDLMDYIQERYELFNCVENETDILLSSVTPRLQAKVSKYEAGVIQIVRKFGKVTIDDCIEKLRQIGAEVPSSHYQLKTFIHYRPNIFDFDEKTDTIYGIYDSNDMTEICARAGIDKVLNLIKDFNQNTMNSMRVNLDHHRGAILFKSEWLYSKAPEYWDSCQAMVASLNAENALFFRQFKSHQFSMCGIHLNSFVDADCIAREIVDILFAADQDHEIRSHDEVFDCLPAKSCSYLVASFSKNFQKKSTSLIRFIEFYPSLFSKNENGQLQLASKQDV